MVSKFLYRFNINGEVILRYIDSLYEFEQKQEKQLEKKKKKVQISNRVTTVNYDRDAEVKKLYQDPPKPK